MTFFYRPGHEVAYRAFGIYLGHIFKVTKYPGSVPSDHHKHAELFHQESIHLKSLTHQHFDFDYPIDKKLVLIIIKKINEYQQTPSLRQEVEKNMRLQMIKENNECKPASLHFASEPTLLLNQQLPVICRKDLESLITKFDDLPSVTFSSSTHIINFLNTSTSVHELSRADGLPLKESLIANTCPILNAIAAMQANHNDYSELLLVGSLGAGALFMMMWLYLFKQLFQEDHKLALDKRDSSFNAVNRMKK